MWIVVTGLAVVAALAIWGFRPHRRSMTRDEVVAILEKWVDGTLKAVEWDYFECCELQDLRLESLRQRCTAISLDPMMTVDPRKSWELNDSGKAAVRSIVREARAHIAVAA